MAKIYEHGSAKRMALVAEMLNAAEGKAKDEQAIHSYVAWHEAEESYPEPDISGLVTWKTECAIVSDLGHIYRAPRPEGVFGSEYDGSYVKIRKENARKAAKRREERQRSRAFRKGELSPMEMLQGMLTLPRH